MDFEEMIHLLAVINGLPKQYILQEMQSAIDESYYNPDPKIQAAWLSMPFFGKPTPEQLIRYLAMHAKKT